MRKQDKMVLLNELKDTLDNQIHKRLLEAYTDIDPVAAMGGDYRE